MQKIYTKIFFVGILLQIYTSSCMDDQPPFFKPKTHEYGRLAINPIWSSSLTRQQLKEQFEYDAKNLAKRINTKFPTKICDAMNYIFEKEPQPSTLAAMLSWSCRHWGTRSQGSAEKPIIKADNNPENLKKWADGLTYMIDDAEKRKHKNWDIHENVYIVAATLQKHRYDLLIQQLSPDLLQRFSAFQPVQEKKPHELKRSYLKAALHLNCQPKKLVFEDLLTQEKRRAYKKQRRFWYK